MFAESPQPAAEEKSGCFLNRRSLRKRRAIVWAASPQPAEEGSDCLNYVMLAILKRMGYIPAAC